MIAVLYSPGETKKEPLINGAKEEKVKRHRTNEKRGNRPTIYKCRRE